MQTPGFTRVFRLAGLRGKPFVLAGFLGILRRAGEFAIVEMVGWGLPGAVAGAILPMLVLFGSSGNEWAARQSNGGGALAKGIVPQGQASQIRPQTVIRARFAPIAQPDRAADF